MLLEVPVKEGVITTERLNKYGGVDKQKQNNECGKADRADRVSNGRGSLETLLQVSRNREASDDCDDKNIQMR